MCRKSDKIKREKSKLVKGSIAHIRAWKRLQVHINRCPDCNGKNGQIDRFEVKA